MDIIAGNDNAFLMCAMEEYMEENRDKPCGTFNHMGWMASGGRSPSYVGATKVLRVQTCVVNDDLLQNKLELEARGGEIVASNG